MKPKMPCDYLWHKAGHQYNEAIPTNWTPFFDGQCGAEIYNNTKEQTKWNCKEQFKYLRALSLAITTTINFKCHLVASAASVVWVRVKSVFEQIVCAIGRKHLFHTWIDRLEGERNKQMPGLVKMHYFPSSSSAATKRRIVCFVWVSNLMGVNILYKIGQKLMSKWQHTLSINAWYTHVAKATELCGPYNNPLTYDVNKIPPALPVGGK